MRRKCVQPIAKPLTIWSESHPVAHAIQTGDHWFQAWRVQECTPLNKLSRITGIPVGRFIAIEGGGGITRAEIDALGRAWGVSSIDLIESMGGKTRIAD